MKKRVAGFPERSADGNLFSFTRDNLAGGRKFKGYGWPATLELLSPPFGKPVDSRQRFEMTICPVCKSVHESGGISLPRHRHSSAMEAIRQPRALFFNSEFFESLNTTTWSYSNPLLGSTVMEKRCG